MQVKMMADGSIMLVPANREVALAPVDFADKPATVELEPAFYVAVDKEGRMVRSVSVTAEDRKVVAALVGNWIAEGFQPVPCNIKQYAKHVRNLAVALKPTADGDAPAAPSAPGAPASTDPGI